MSMAIALAMTPKQKNCSGIGHKIVIFQIFFPSRQNRRHWTSSEREGQKDEKTSNDIQLSSITTT